MLHASSVLITGGTGSFGNYFVPSVLEKFDLKKLVVFSRDEMKQWEMAEQYRGCKKIQFVIGDVRDSEAIGKALAGIDYVIHAAATKIVPTAEYNPFECIKTNINGSMNVVDACIRNSVKRLIALSTDKASNPINLYGASKLVADKLFIASNFNEKRTSTKFSIVRYGNVIGSRGSIIPFFLSMEDQDVLPITDKRMTRFMITLPQAVEFVCHALEDMVGGEIYIKKIPSMKVVDIATAINPKATQKVIGLRPGEKIHEQLISNDDAQVTFEYDSYFKILPTIHNWSKDRSRIKGGRLVDTNFVYDSETNDHWLTIQDLRSWIKSNRN